MMANMPEFEVVGGVVSSEELSEEIQSYIANPGGGFDMSQRQLQVKKGVNLENLVFPDLGYASSAQESYNIFKALKESGVIHDSCRFQISLPTPLAPIQTFISPKGYRDSVSLYEEYKKAMLNEIQTLIDTLPLEELAIQWDVCIEIIMLENRQSNEDVSSWHTAINEELCLLGDCVPEPIEVGYHFCYGDINHKHFFEPIDMSLMTELANTISQGVSRKIQWFHMPVPHDRDDAEYFQSLKELQLNDDTQLFLGLVHYTDGVDGTLKRINTALQYTSNIGISTECGLGRRDPASIPKLLDIHFQAANSY